MASASHSSPIVAGNTSLWTQEIPGGRQTQIVATKRNHLRPTGTLTLRVLDENNQPSPARVFVGCEDQRAYAPDDAWMHADDSFVRSERPFEAHYFHSAGVSQLTVPAGTINVGVMKGFEYAFEKQTVKISAAQNTRSNLTSPSLKIAKEAGRHWVSGDVHVHMNYGGACRNTPSRLVVQAAAENLSIVEDLIVNK